MSALLIALALAAPERVVVVARPVEPPGLLERLGKRMAAATRRLYERDDEGVARGNGLVLRGGGSDLGVLQLLPELDKLQKGDLESRLSVQYDDRYGWFAWPAFVLLCAAAALGDGPFWRRRPA